MIQAKLLSNNDRGLLKGDVAALLPKFPEHLVLVVEKDGAIVATAAVVRMTHLEGAWIDPAERGNPGIGRALIRGLEGILARYDEPVIAATDNDVVQRVLCKIGAQELPVMAGTKAYWLEGRTWRAHRREELAWVG